MLQMHSEIHEMKQRAKIEKGEDMVNVQKGKNKVKCVVWDMDNTLWEGTLLEDNNVFLRGNVLNIIKTLDSRGILQSVASKNEYTSTIAKLQEFGLSEYFLYPQINWDAKSSSINAIAKLINIGLDTIAFIDDQSFEREEVKFSLPEVLCIDTADLDDLLDMPEMNPLFITEDSKFRRIMYLNDMQRNKAEENFAGTSEEFLASLNMVFTISPVGKGDLERAEELTLRTNQLNTTGYTYSYHELDNFRNSPQHKLLIAGLEDKYGNCGKIGLNLIECHEDVWIIKLLLMSCRVMSRGVGTIMINHIMNMARKENVRLQAEFISNDRNRMMYITYKFAGFKEIKEDGNHVILENDMALIQPFPEYMKIQILEGN